MKPSKCVLCVKFYIDFLIIPLWCSLWILHFQLINSQLLMHTGNWYRQPLVRTWSQNVIKEKSKNKMGDKRFKEPRQRFWAPSVQFLSLHCDRTLTFYLCFLELIDLLQLFLITISMKSLEYKISDQTKEILCLDYKFSVVNKIFLFYWWLICGRQPEILFRRCLCAINPSQ